MARRARPASRLRVDAFSDAARRRCQRSARWRTLYDGFDPTTEVLSVRTQRLSDTVLLRDGDRVVGFAVCRRGAGSEAGSGACYVKIGAVCPARAPASA